MRALGGWGGWGVSCEGVVGIYAGSAHLDSSCGDAGVRSVIGEVGAGGDISVGVAVGVGMRMYRVMRCCRRVFGVVGGGGMCVVVVWSWSSDCCGVGLSVCVNGVNGVGAGAAHMSIDSVVVVIWFI